MKYGNHIPGFSYLETSVSFVHGADGVLFHFNRAKIFVLSSGLGMGLPYISSDAPLTFNISLGGNLMWNRAIGSNLIQYSWIISGLRFILRSNWISLLSLIIGVLGPNVRSRVLVSLLSFETWMLCCSLVVQILGAQTWELSLLVIL